MATKAKTKYNGSDLLKSKKYQDVRDVLTVVIDVDKSYTMEEVDTLIKSFLAKEVK